MKRWPFLMAAVLLLCGCSAEPEETTPIPPTPIDHIAIHATEPIGYYDPDSTLEASTDGAVRAYPLNRTDSYAMVFLADDLLLLSGEEVTTLTKLTGDSLYVSAAANLSCYIPADSPSFHAGPRGVTYYDESHRQLVYLDTGLKEVSRFDLPETAVGVPALTADRKMLYYRTVDSIRAIDLETNLDKLLRQTSDSCPSLTALHLNNTVLECRTEDSRGNVHTLFISTKTGETLYETDNDLSVLTKDTAFFALHQEGEYLEILTGSTESAPNILITPEYGVSAEPIPERGIAVQSASGTEHTDMNCYDLTTGLRTHTIRLPGTDRPWNMLGSGADPWLWFIRYDPECESDILCRWDLRQSASDDETVYLSPRPTPEEPDQGGIAAVKKEAAALGRKYGVEILLWNDITTRLPRDYQVEGEYQVPLLRHYLQILRQALSVYPDGFLKEAAEGTGNGKIHIGLVRSITAGVGTDEPGVHSGIQFWDQNENVFIVLSIGDDFVSSLYNELALVIDYRVLISCTAFDNWEALNPDTFAYSYSYKTPFNRDNSLLSGENRAFIDAFSTTFPREDRARIMEYAMQEDNEEFFESPVMQKKLRQLCKGIREAFGLKKSPEVFPWEQYLEKPLAKK